MTAPSLSGIDQHRRVLVVDDDDSARRDFVSTLTSAGYEVAEGWSVVQAMRLLLSFRPGAVVLDMILPDGDGAEVGRAMKAIVTTRQICVVAVTSRASALTLESPSSFGARTILLKPLDPATLLSAIAECFDPIETCAPAEPMGLVSPPVY